MDEASARLVEKALDRWAAEIARLRALEAQLRAWSENQQVWALHGSYMDGYQAARHDVLRMLNKAASSASP